MNVNLYNKFEKEGAEDEKLAQLQVIVGVSSCIDIDRNKYAKFTTDELLSIFKEEAEKICKKPDEVHSMAESALNDFIKKNRKYVKFIEKL